MMGKNPHVSLSFQTVWHWSSPKKMPDRIHIFFFRWIIITCKFLKQAKKQKQNTFVAKVPQMPITRLIKDLIHLGVANDRCHTGIPNLNPSKSIRMKSKRTHEILIEKYMELFAGRWCSGCFDFVLPHFCWSFLDFRFHELIFRSFLFFGVSK